MNPELQRNLWLDATPRRLVWTGTGVFIAFILLWIIDRGRHASALTFLGAMIFFAAAVALGPSAARRSVTAEVMAHTWDFQRLSALSAWTLTWGKLVGSTLRLWAMAAGGLLIAFLQLASTSSFSHALFWLLVGLGLAVTSQAGGLATGLLDVRRARANGRMLSGRASGLLILILSLLTCGALVWGRARIGHVVSDVLGLVGLSGWVFPADGEVPWFGHAFPEVGFAAFSLAMCAAWALVWAWRLMRLELQLSNTPWAWALFVAGTAIYALGFDPADTLEGGARTAARLVHAALALAALAYAGAFAEPADRIRARQFATALTRREPGRALTRLPLVALPSALAIAAGLLVALIQARGDDPGRAVFTLALLAFFARDLGVIAWRRFSRRGGAGDFGVVATLAGLYVIGGGLGWLFGRGSGAAAFLPDAHRASLSLLMGLIEAVAIWAWAALRISRPAHRPWKPSPRPSTIREAARPVVITPLSGTEAPPPHPPSPSMGEGRGEGEPPARCE